MSPACPRCAYDLSGIAETWTDQCPLTGVCSECGLELLWIDAYFPDRERVRGLIEHSRGLPQSAWWSIRTLWLVARPWTFWRRVTMAMTPRLNRVFIWVFALTAALWAVGSVLSNTIYSFTLAPTLAVPDSVGLLNGWTQPLVALDMTPPWQLPPGAAPTVTWTQRLAPLGVAGGGYYYGAPDWTAVIAALLAAAAAWPAIFIILKDTRRLGKLRRDHLLRAAWYSLALLPFLALLRLVYVAGWVKWAAFAPLSSRRSWYYNSPWEWFGDRVPHDLWIGAIVVLWLQAWWLAAIVLGFRLQTGIRLWALLAAVSCLIAALTWLFCAGTQRLVQLV